MADRTRERAAPRGAVVPFRRARPRARRPGIGTDPYQELELVVACGLVLDQIAQEYDRSLESVYEALVRFRMDLDAGAEEA